jgi:ERCC4-type nuclease
MHPVEIGNSLDTFVILTDTREQPTRRAAMRYQQFGVPIKREKLDFGDYSAECTLPDGGTFSLQGKVAIERKMNLDELAHCYCQDRKRFEREFERAKAAGAKVYLLIENGNIDMAYAGRYRSRVSPQSFTASIFAWLARYDCQLIFCNENTSGQAIHDILYREMKQALEGLPDELP